MTKTTYSSKSPIFAAAGGGSIFDKFQYSSAVKAGGLVFIAGQIGLNPDGSMPDTSEQQFVNAFERLKLVVEDAGSQMSDLVELVSYHVGLNSHLADFMRVKEKYVPAPFPTWTILDIAGLARPGLIIEIKAVAVARN
ncbi:RidA family protein [Bradyrhizobium canariense]|uniref:RidA family protein n=1 Tax=Bradyrhizobium canariense TaxID=255045 RepID=UPI001CA536A1|nr:RidA family protein [Bradyrhizobium canariense]MBW5435724.1 RidA family protein [Bradyrhizobium canariense]